MRVVKNSTQPMERSQNVTIRERVIINKTKEKQPENRYSSAGKSKTGVAYYNALHVKIKKEGMDMEYCITAETLKEIMDLISKGWVCEKFDHEETLYVKCTNGKQSKEFELVGC